MLNNQVNLTISKKFLLCQEPIFYCSFLCWKHLFIFILLRSHSSKRRFIYYYFIESKSIVIIHPILSKTLIHISCKTIYTSPLFLSPVLFLQYFLIIRNTLFHVRFINKKTLYALFDRFGTRLIWNSSNQPPLPTQPIAICLAQFSLSVLITELY